MKNLLVIIIGGEKMENKQDCPCENREELYVCTDTEEGKDCTRVDEAPKCFDRSVTFFDQ